MVSWSMRQLRTRSLSLTSLSSRERSRSPLRNTESSKGWKRLRSAISCKQQMRELQSEQDAWATARRENSPEPMPRTASPSPERWVQSRWAPQALSQPNSQQQFVVPENLFAVPDLAPLDQWSCFGGFAGCEGVVGSTPPSTWAHDAPCGFHHCWNQEPAWEPSMLCQNLMMPPVVASAHFQGCLAQATESRLESKFGALATLVQDRSKIPVVEEILAELKCSSPAERQEIILWLAPSAVELSLTSSGTRLVQEALDCAENSSWKVLLQWLQPRAVELSRSRHGNFVLQKMAVRMNSSEAAGLVEVLSGHVLEVAQQTYGCRSFERLIEHFADPELTPILDELVSNARELAVHKHANYAISAILEHGRPERQQQVVEALLPDISMLVMNRVATHVVERMLELGEDVKTFCVDAWLGCISPSILEMALSKFGSFLLADFAKESCERNRLRICEALGPCLAHLQATDEGRRVAEAYGL